MSSRERLQVAGGHYHVVARAVPGEALFRNDVDRRWFLKPLGKIISTLHWQIWAYCLMTTHYHLVVETPSPDLARGIQYVNGVYAQGFNWRWNRYGHLFAERYSSRFIDSEEYLAEACRYVLDNPVRAGAVGSPTDWQWSGGRAFADMAAGLTSELALGPGAHV